MGEEAKSWHFWHRTNLAKLSLAINARGHAVERARQIFEEWFDRVERVEREERLGGWG